MFKNSFTRRNTISSGGYNWHVKCPFLLLGALSVTFGSRIERLRNPFIIPMRLVDKAIPLIIIGCGVLLGYSMKVNSHILSRLLFLTPSTQSTSDVNVYGHLYKSTDKGWIGSVSLSFAPISRLISFYTPTAGLGLSILLLYLLYYDKYDKLSSSPTRRLRRGTIDQ